MAIPHCTTCSAERCLIGAEPLVGQYEVRLFRCPICETVLRLACRAGGNGSLTGSVDEATARNPPLQFPTKARERRT